MLSDLQIERLIKPVLGRPFVFLETTLPDRQNRRCLLFSDFNKVLTFRPGDSARDFFASVEKYLSEGYWACGYFEYEFGYFLEPALAALRPQGRQALAWIGICQKPVELNLAAPAPEAGAVSKKDLSDSGCTDIRAEVSFADYRKSIGRIHRWLRQGQTYQINYTFGLKFRCSRGPLPLYLRLRRNQPTAYTAWIHTGERHVLSFSPELFLRRNGRQMTVCPMKGTARRGLSAAGDVSERAQLVRDEKIRSENLMIVDLLRNDLGRISECVRAGKLFEIQKYRTLYQMISTVRARLKKGAGLAEIFGALFPSGSVTGAPKIRSMQLIRKLERAPRGVYTGAIGYMHGAGACFNVPIRTLVLNGQNGRMGVGGGIVEASTAVSEYREALLKSEFLRSDMRDFYVFETMLWQKNRPIAYANLHLKRLAASCDYFQIPFSKQRATESLKILTARLRSDQARIRLSVGLDGTLRLESGLVAPVSEPVRVGLCPERVDSSDIFLYHKTSPRARYDRWRFFAQKKKLFEIIFCNEKGQLTEGTITNLFVKIRGRLVTPPVECGLLPGVLREYLLRKKLVCERILRPADLKKADAVYVGNSVRGLVRAQCTH